MRQGLRVREYNQVQAPLICVGARPRPDHVALAAAWRSIWAAGPGPRRGTRGLVWKVGLIAALAVSLTLGLLLVDEAKTSSFQARWFADRASRLTFAVEAGPSPVALYAPEGPFDQRMGYTALPDTVERLRGRGYSVASQARASPRMLELREEGLFPIFREKTQTGLQILDARGRLIHSFDYPRQVYEDFEAVPPVVVDTLLFVENRSLLDEQYPHRNPAVDWRRLSRAVWDKGWASLGSDRDVPGGSTLATQMEKFRHSQAGRTDSVDEKIRQMLTASYRVYLDGEHTLAAQQALVVKYLNSVPLGARAGWGEVHGVGDGARAWFGVDFEQINSTLHAGMPEDDEQGRAAFALAYRQMLSLTLAQQRPVFFLPRRVDALNARADFFLHLLAQEGVISAELRDAALEHHVALSEAGAVAAAAVERTQQSKARTHAVNNLQAYLRELLGVERLYALNRYDLVVQATLDAEIQGAVANTFERLEDPNYLQELGLGTRRFLGGGPGGQSKSDQVTFGFTLYERGEHGHKLRVQVDSRGGGFNINDESKMDMGSTAKLRTLVTYLEVVAELHDELGGRAAAELKGVPTRKADRLTRWAIAYLSANPDATMAQMLEASMGRTYSGSPNASFQTSGGRHVFGNASRRHNSQSFTVRRAFSASANLPFVRIMRDIVEYHITRLPDDAAVALEDLEDGRRTGFLEEFAARDARKYVSRFYDRHTGRTFDEMLDAMFADLPRTWDRLALAFRSAAPDEDVEAFARFVRRHRRVSDARARELFDDVNLDELYERQRARDVDPIEVWVVSYLRENPEATRHEIMRDSANVRERARDWLLWPADRAHDDQRVWFALEEQAFAAIHARWHRLGYPFDYLVPSFATALGSSADRPSALAELVGILLHDGVRHPLVRVEELHFARGTPYETRVVSKPDDARRVLPSEVAAVAREALVSVVKTGTGRPLRDAFETGDGQQLTIGGKTGTADHQHMLYDRDGRIIGSQTRARTASWVFHVGDCYFGTITALVEGPEAEGFRFMSSLSVRLLRALAQDLAPLWEVAPECGER